MPGERLQCAKSGHRGAQTPTLKPRNSSFIYKDKAVQTAIRRSASTGRELRMREWLLSVQQCASLKDTKFKHIEDTKHFTPSAAVEIARKGRCVHDLALHTVRNAYFAESMKRMGNRLFMFITTCNGDCPCQFAGRQTSGSWAGRKPDR